MEQRQTWIATAAVILSVIAAAWTVGRNTATAADIREFGTATAADISELRAEIGANS